MLSPNLAILPETLRLYKGHATGATAISIREMLQCNRLEQLFPSKESGCGYLFAGTGGTQEYGNIPYFAGIGYPYGRSKISKGTSANLTSVDRINLNTETFAIYGNTLFQRSNSPASSGNHQAAWISSGALQQENRTTVEKFDYTTATSRYYTGITHRPNPGAVGSSVQGYVGTGTTVIDRIHYTVDSVVNLPGHSAFYGRQHGRGFGQKIEGILWATFGYSQGVVIAYSTGVCRSLLPFLTGYGQAVSGNLAIGYGYGGMGNPSKPQSGVQKIDVATKTLSDSLQKIVASYANCSICGGNTSWVLGGAIGSGSLAQRHMLPTDTIFKIPAMLSVSRIYASCSSDSTPGEQP